MHGASFPAEYAAGDHFDFLEMPDGSIGFVVGDVSGHGVGPALLMASTRAFVRSFATVNNDVGEILAQTNHSLLVETEEDRFITLFFGCLEPITRLFSYSNAGHPPGFVFDQAGKVKARLESTGFPLAVSDNGGFPPGQPVSLQRGDLVLLLTDGVFETESPQGGLFGVDRTLDVVRRHRTLDSRAIIEQLHAALADFTKGRALVDDVTLVVIKVEN